MPLDATKSQDERSADVERAVRCARCGHALTSFRERIEVAGRHGQVFMNPSGVIFHVVMYRTVDGARVSGVPDAETSWFPGTAWVYAHCADCNGHVGWSYVNLDDGARFFGLIEDTIST